jgi:hypothetical protein
MIHNEFVARLSCTEWTRSVRGEVFLSNGATKYRKDAQRKEILRQAGTIS